MAADAARLALPEIGRPWRLALLGDRGMLARKVRELAPAGCVVGGFDLPGFNLTDAAQVAAALDGFAPDIICNCAAFTAVDACEEREAEALAVNGTAVGNLAALARQTGALLLHLSTDYVFAGDQRSPYREAAATAPQSAYGRTKLAGEQAILASGLQRYLIVRTSWLYGPGGRNFVATILGLAAERDELRVVADQVGSPTYTGDLAEALYRLLAAVLDAERQGDPGGFGVYHFSNAGECSWFDLAVAAIEQARAHGRQLRVRQVHPIATADYPLPAPRPAYSVLATDRYRQLTGCPVPSWQDGLRRYIEETGCPGQPDKEKPNHD